MLTSLHQPPNIHISFPTHHHPLSRKRTYDLFLDQENETPEIRTRAACTSRERFPLNPRCAADRSNSIRRRDSMISQSMLAALSTQPISHLQVQILPPPHPPLEKRERMGYAPFITALSHTGYEKFTFSSLTTILQGNLTHLATTLGADLSSLLGCIFDDIHPHLNVNINIKIELYILPYGILWLSEAGGITLPEIVRTYKELNNWYTTTQAPDTLWEESLLHMQRHTWWLLGVYYHRQQRTRNPLVWRTWRGYAEQAHQRVVENIPVEREREEGGEGQTHDFPALDFGIAEREAWG